MFKKESKLKRFDFILLFTTIILCVYGFIVINSATLSKTFGSEPFLKTQITAFALGMVAVFILLFIDYDIYGGFYLPIYGITVALLIYVLINPVRASEWGDVRSWMSIGPIVFQPSELAKFGVIISVSKFIDIHKDSINNPAVLIKILVFAFFPIALIMMQPDLGTSLVFIFFIAVMLFVAGIDRKYIIAVLVIAFVLLIIGLMILYNIMQDYVPKKDYRVDRIVTFFYPELDPEDTGYHVIQSKIAIGSGMIYGRGLFKGVQNQLNYLPTKETDFIFAVIGEELGLIGGLLLLCLYGILFYRLIKIARNASNLFGSLIVTGIAAMQFFHIFENVGMTMGLLPVTGIPLPFISYGGTFMLVNTVSIGLALSVGLKRAKVSMNDF
ncbi:rod shape-determining protein RodA [Sedimentibacter hydroxybenzoicus DSM 7310]|uniref:Rod shape-determining protein RodA n=1 Tax=Sedimentibacter hydroxybenzoicus DSM 7310 TaxID=1123245 RepID=A0A974BLL9_SEDHY|nr:rod shape-determining protein RodA [Sedimentibacter hydroxybenzoicus]NYB75629.1 rod shape-determining protein RodA [Sedimentibacter hydroxybenzoicus DSM 7310]